jgi:hypothetical protein
MTHYLHKVSCKSSTFCDGKVWIRILIEITGWIRIPIETNTDPQHWLPDEGLQERRISY